MSAPIDTAPSTTAPAPKRKARALLQAYYAAAIENAANSPSVLSGGNNATPIGATSSATSKKRTDPFDIDGPAFDVDKYIVKVLQDQPLQALMARDNDLVSDIRELDSHMKTLVYENYNKFISATDTIRKMKGQIDNIESELSLLQKHVDHINASAASVNDALAEKRSTIHQLSGVHSLLQKLQFIYDLPQKLKQCLKQRSFAQAVRHYTRTSRLLAHYRHITVFKKIEDECKQIMNEIGKLLRERMNDTQSKTTEICESIQLLVGLGTYDARELWKEFIYVTSMHLQKLKTKATSHKNTMTTSTLPSLSPSINDLTMINEDEADTTPLLPEASLAKSKISFLDSSLLPDLAMFLSTFYDTFVGEETTGSNPDLAKKPTRPGVWVADLSEDDKKKAAQDINRVTEDFLKEYFAVVHEILVLPSDITVLFPQLHFAVFDQIHADIAANASLNRYASMNQRLNSCFSEWLSRVTTQLFSYTTTSLFNEIESSLSIISNDRDDESWNHEAIMKKVDNLGTFLADSLVGKCLPVLRGILQFKSSFAEGLGASEILSLMQQKFNFFWGDLFQAMMKWQSSNERKTSRGSLIMSRLCLDLSRTLVDVIYTAFNEDLAGVKTRRKANNTQSISGTFKRPPYYSRVKDFEHTLTSNTESGEECREVSTLAREFTEYLLGKYVEIITNQITIAARTQITSTNWRSMREPTDVSSWINDIAHQIIQFEQEVGAFYEDDGSLERRLKQQQQQASSHRRERSNMHQRSGSDMSSGPRTHMYMNQIGQNSSPNAMNTSPTRLAADVFNNIDKLFTDRIEYFGGFSLTRGGILFAVIKMVLKMLCEEWRQQTFDKNGLAQVQLDVEFLRMKWWKYGIEDKVFNLLLDEIVAHTFKRSVEQKLLNLTIVEEALSKYDGASL